MYKTLTSTQIYQWLQGHFQIGEDCWTSSLRAHYDLAPYKGDESACSDFTVSDFVISKQITEWLLSNNSMDGANVLKGLHGVSLTYHFEVKTTAEPRNEPFTVSANQFDLVRY